MPATPDPNAAAPDGDHTKILSIQTVDRSGDVHDFDAINRRLLDPADPDTLRRLLDGLRALEPDRYRPTTEDTP